MSPATRVRFGWCGVVLAGVAFLGGTLPRALAQPVQEGGTAPISQPTSRPVDPQVEQKARQIIDQALAKYRSLRSYADTFSGRYELVALDGKGQDVGETRTYTANLAVAHPNRLALVTDSFAVHCDGKRLWLYADPLGEYTEASAPEKLNYEELLEPLPLDDPPHLVLHLLTHPDKKLEELFPMIRGFTAVSAEKRGDQPGQRISGMFDATDTPFGLDNDLIPFSLWFDDRTGLLGELSIDLTGVMRKALGLTETQPSPPDEEREGWPVRIDKAVATARFENVRVDQEIPADKFVFRPAPDVEKVEKFTNPAEMPDPRDLIGKPAPTFAGTGLDEKPLSLEALRGQVVILDFWATWCRPCVESMPKIQKIHEKYANKGVTVVGINEDDKETEKKVQAFLKDKGITFRQFADPKGKLGRKYNVAAIPSTFLIDKEGVIQAVHVGFSEDLETELAKQVEKLLRGEKLFDPTKVKSDAAPEKPTAP